MEQLARAVEKVVNAMHRPLHKKTDSGNHDAAKLSVFTVIWELQAMLKTATNGARAHVKAGLLPIYFQLFIASLELSWKILKIVFFIGAWLLRHHLLLVGRCKELAIAAGGEPVVKYVESVVEGVANHPLVVAACSWFIGALLWAGKLAIQLSAGYPVPLHIESEVAQQFEEFTEIMPDPYHEQLRDAQVQVSRMRRRQKASVAGADHNAQRPTAS